MTTRSKTKGFNIFGRYNKRSSTKPRTNHQKRRRIRNILIAIVALLIIIRLILPYVVLKYVNNKLAGLEDYYGHVEDIDLSLYRGAYVIKDLKILKTEKVGKKIDSIPFFKTPVIDLSVQWKALLKGRA